MKGVFLPFQRGFIGAVLLQSIEVFQEQEPGGLLGVIQFGGATGFFPEDIVDVLEGLLEHGWHSSWLCRRGEWMPCRHPTHLPIYRPLLRTASGVEKPVSCVMARVFRP